MDGWVGGWVNREIVKEKRREEGGGKVEGKEGERGKVRSLPYNILNGN